MKWHDLLPSQLKKTNKQLFATLYNLQYVSNKCWVCKAMRHNILYLKADSDFVHTVSPGMILSPLCDPV